MTDHDIRWIGLSMLSPRRGVAELRDVTAQRTLYRVECEHVHRTTKAARECGKQLAAIRQEEGTDGRG